MSNELDDLKAQLERELAPEFEVVRLLGEGNMASLKRLTMSCVFLRG